MPISKDKSTIATVVPNDLKERIQRVADAKKWTLSQTVKELVEEFLKCWEEELGITEKPAKKSRASK
jgi:hypothetical protein